MGRSVGRERWDAPSEPQRKYLQVLQKKLHLPGDVLDAYCQHERFGRPVATLTKGQMSQLIDELVGWGETLPAGLQRAKGQRDLPGLAVGHG